MRSLLVLFLSLLLYHIGYSQSDSLKLNVVNIEVLGPGLVGSINYERLLKIRNDRYLDLSVGLDLSFPEIDYPHEAHLGLAQVNMLFGEKHFLELGYTSMLNPFPVKIVNDNRPWKGYNSFRVGFRYQDLKKGGFMFRVGITPILSIEFRREKILLPWMGLTFGYSF